MKLCKKFISIVLTIAFVLTICCGTAVSTSAAEITTHNMSANIKSGDYVYSKLKNGTITICDYTGNETDLTIPDTIDGYTVSALDEWSFYWCKKLENVVVPDSVTSIGNRSFFGCNNLKSITLPEKLVSVGSYVFYDCSGLTNITIPSSVISMGTYNFAYCTNLSSINVGENNPRFKSVEGVLFSADGKNLLCYPAGKSNTSYTVPDNVKFINAASFLSCRNLRSLCLNDGVVSIASEAFMECSFLNSIVIPDSVTSIGSGAFDTCGKLTSVILSKNITAISKHTFADCYMLKDIIIPDGVTSIGKYAFYCCKSLMSLELPSSLTELGDYAFYDCYNLTSVKVPDALTAIGEKSLGYRYDDSQSPYFKVVDGFAIYGNTSAPAQTYATDNDIEFLVTEVNAPNSTKLYRKGKMSVESAVVNPFGDTTYSSSNSSVVSVNAEGVITAKKAGKATITITNDGKSDSFTVVVKNPTLNKKTVKLKVNKSFNIKVKGQIGILKYKTSNKSVATVNAKGKIVAKKKGTATITVKTNEMNLKCTVKVE